MRSATPRLDGLTNFQVLTPLRATTQIRCFSISFSFMYESLAQKKSFADLFLCAIFHLLANSASNSKRKYSMELKFSREEVKTILLNHAIYLLGDDDGVLFNTVEAADYQSIPSAVIVSYEEPEVTNETL
jgi:hypothetical protein